MCEYERRNLYMISPSVFPLCRLWLHSEHQSAVLLQQLNGWGGHGAGRQQSRPLQRRRNWIPHTLTHTHLSFPPSLSLLSFPSLSLSFLITSGVLRVSECEKPPWRSHQGSNQHVNAKCTLLLRCDDGGGHWESLSGAKISAYANSTKDLNGFDVHKSVSDPFRDVVTGSQEKNMCRLAY